MANDSVKEENITDHTDNNSTFDVEDILKHRVGTDGNVSRISHNYQLILCAELCCASATYDMYRTYVVWNLQLNELQVSISSNIHFHFSLNILWSGKDFHRHQIHGNRHIISFRLKRFANITKKGNYGVWERKRNVVNWWVMKVNFCYIRVSNEYKLLWKNNLIFARRWWQTTANPRTTHQKWMEDVCHIIPRKFWIFIKMIKANWSHWSNSKDVQKLRLCQPNGQMLTVRNWSLNSMKIESIGP